MATQPMHKVLNTKPIYVLVEKIPNKPSIIHVKKHCEGLTDLEVGRFLQARPV